MALLFPLATAGWGWGWGWNWREEEAWVEGGGSEGKGKKEEPLRDGTGFGQEILEGPFPLRRGGGRVVGRGAVDAGSAAPLPATLAPP